MIALEEYKKALGEELLKELSEEQILNLRDQQDQEAEIYFSMWLENIRNNKIEL